MRMRTKWFKNHGQRSVDETSSALGFIFWQIAIDRLKSLRSAEVEVFNPQISIDVLAELAIFLIHSADRIIHEKYSAEERAEIIQKLALNVATNYADNATDALGVADHRSIFIDRLNQRLARYSQIEGKGEGLRFSLVKLLGEFVEPVMSEQDQSWITQQLIEIEIPELFTKFDRACDSLLTS